VLRWPQRRWSNSFGKYLSWTVQWQKNRMAKEAGLSVNAVNGIHDNFWNPTFRTLNKLEAYLIQKGYADD